MEFEDAVTTPPPEQFEKVDPEIIKLEALDNLLPTLSTPLDPETYMSLNEQVDTVAD
jgi:hypothetical protein